MNQQEAYQQLYEKLEAINKAIREAASFALANDLQMGQPRSAPAHFEAVNPETGMPDGYDDRYDKFVNYESWIGSEVCY